MAVQPTMICGKMCMKSITEDSLKCANCGVTYHQECVNIQKALSTPLIKWKSANVQFRCDRCVENDQTLQNNNLTMMKELKMIEKKNQERFEMLINKIAKIEQTMTASGKQVVEKIVQVVEENNGEQNASWSNVLRQKKKKTNDPVIVITPKDPQQKRNATKKTLESTIDPSEFTVKNTKNSSNNGIIISCESEESCTKLMNIATEKMGENYEVKKPAKRLPRFKILKVIEAIDDDSDLIRKIKKRNMIISDDRHKLEIVKREQVRAKGENIEGCNNIVVQTDGETFNKVIANGHLNIGWERYKVVDNVYIRRCYKCYGFNHNARECKSELACSKCSLPHLRKECKSNEEKCINCVETNKRLELNLNVHHNVWSSECRVYQRKLESSKKAISYVE